MLDDSCLKSLRDNEMECSVRMTERMDRICVFDGVRVLAMIGVFVWHTYPPRAFLGVQLPDLGARCCELFFLVSGLLEGYRHRDEFDCTVAEQASILKRKLVMFYPLHIAMFLTSFVMKAAWTSLNSALLFSVLLNLTLTQAWSPKLMFSFNGVSWFLSALIFCYAMMPILAYISKIVRARFRFYPLVLLVIGFLSLRVYIEFVSVENPDLLTLSFHANPFIRILEFASAYYAGSVISEYRDGHEVACERPRFCHGILSWTIWEVLIALIVTWCVCKFDSTWLRGYYVVLLLVCLVQFSAERGGLSQLLGSRPFTRIAHYLLPFFMSHQLIFMLVRKVAPSISVEMQMCLTLLAVIVFCLAWDGLERRVRVGIKKTG